MDNREVNFRFYKEEERKFWDEIFQYFQRQVNYYYSNNLDNYNKMLSDGRK